MRHKWFWLVIVIILVIISMALGACNTASADSGNDPIQFVPETNSKYIGSYLIFRTNKGVEWTERGEWKNDIELFFDHTCVKLTYEPYGDFRAANGYYWEYSKTFWNEPCLKLQKYK